MKLYETDLLPEVAENLKYSPGILDKINKYKNVPKRESIHYRFKESCFWDYSEGRGWRIECNGHQYFDRIINKYVGKPFSHVIHKCRTHPKYKHCKGFKRQVEDEIKEVMKKVMVDRYPWPGQPSLEGEYYIDMKGILRSIDQHPDYYIVPNKERIIYKDWRDPTRMTTSSRKCIRKINGVYCFVSSHDQVKFIYKSYLNGEGEGNKIINPEFFEVPLTNSQLQMYHLSNDKVVMY